MKTICASSVLFLLAKTPADGLRTASDYNIPGAGRWQRVTPVANSVTWDAVT
jgi:hypothetical protein